LIAHFFNSFLLGSVGGDVLKAYYVARETHHKKTEAIITVVVDRIIGLFSMLILACIMMLLNTELLVTLNNKLKAVIWLILGMTGGCASQRVGLTERRGRGVARVATFPGIGARGVDQVHDARADLGAGIPSHHRIRRGCVRRQRDGQQRGEAAQVGHSGQSMRESRHVMSLHVAP
jgi:hypothetical protein